MKCRVLVLLLLVGVRRGRANIVEDDIFYQKEEVEKLSFSLDHRVRDKSTKETVGHTNGVNAYAYVDKAIAKVFPLISEQEIKKFFSLNKDVKTCDYQIGKGSFKNYLKNNSCYRKIFCGVIVDDKDIRGESKRKRKSDLIHCAYMDDKHIVIYHVGKPHVVKPNVVYEEIFFQEREKGIINCNGMNINLRYIGIHTSDNNSCIQEYFEEHLKKVCNQKRSCEIDFNNVNKGNNCHLGSNFLIHVNYECEDSCNAKKNQTCDIYNGEGRVATCSYGYNMLQGGKETCERNYTCSGSGGSGSSGKGSNRSNGSSGSGICSVNQFCDEATNSCTCKTSLLSVEKKECSYTDVCKAMKCPQNSTCALNPKSKKAECKCEQGKYFHKNRCYDITEMEKLIKAQTTPHDKAYKNELFIRSALKPEHIYMNCEGDYTIEVVNATLSCYNVPFKDNKIKYITDTLREVCDGRARCAFGNSLKRVSTLDPLNTCETKGTIYHYEYVCVSVPGESSATSSRAAVWAQLGSDASQKIHTKGKGAIFRSRFNSQLQCPGGSITVNRALLKAGDGCEDLDLTKSVKEYCDQLSFCDVGLTHHFDTYCKTDQYLFVHYTCEDLCKTCSANETCYGNRHKYKCFCNSPYVSKGSYPVCIKPQKCEPNTCGEHQTCTIVNNKATCKCEYKYRDVNGECLPEDKCDLLCPSNKSCVMENGRKICRCLNGLSLVNGVCICPEDSKYEGDICIPNNKCKRKENKNLCTKKNEQCVYNEQKDIMTCDCMEHHKRNEQGNCVPIDYCKEVTCKENEVCKVVGNKATCQCKENLRRNSNNECIYENLCVNNRGNCPQDSDCIYHERKQHECRCHKKGRVAVNGKCVIPDMCMTEQNKCSENSICVNQSNKKPLCVCLFNFVKSRVGRSKEGDQICAVVNPCLTHNGGCSTAEVCTFKNGKRDKTFTFPWDDDMVIILGSCGIIQFVQKSDQVIWKINRSNNFYIFNYEYPSEGTLEAQIANNNESSILYLKKTHRGKVLYADFELGHEKCSYENMFPYGHRKVA
ncbi:hypothetical protein C922_02102 [Plasmodium inui San Antonio 1]|uniref:EGF-like domain-containing protein n=1 Tax=Plasmodium inui San Antonio 1 TaxID=1237626 RepID=W7APQ2_9APIC|nr:hypothetical protein C922_02102 [Plasmodium inui San Antonio 1]EUD67396.1 hypothetical protein C922_02102 [Plasmodium inui San Antonio 1]